MLDRKRKEDEIKECTFAPNTQKPNLNIDKNLAIGKVKGAK